MGTEQRPAGKGRKRKAAKGRKRKAGKGRKRAEERITSVIERKRWRTVWRGCERCGHKGCAECRCNVQCGVERVTVPTRLPREIACRVCGAVGDADDPYCKKCGH